MAGNGPNAATEPPLLKDSQAAFTNMHHQQIYSATQDNPCPGSVEEHNADQYYQELASSESVYQNLPCQLTFFDEHQDSRNLIGDGVCVSPKITQPYPRVTSTESVYGNGTDQMTHSAEYDTQFMCHTAQSAGNLHQKTTNRVNVHGYATCQTTPSEDEDSNAHLCPQLTSGENIYGNIKHGHSLYSTDHQTSCVEDVHGTVRSDSSCHLDEFHTSDNLVKDEGHSLKARDFQCPSVCTTEPQSKCSVMREPVYGFLPGFPPLSDELEELRGEKSPVEISVHAPRGIEPTGSPDSSELIYGDVCSQSSHSASLHKFELDSHSKSGGNL